MGYTGKDVVLGVMDVGFDFTHPTFYDTLGKTYRIKRIWEEKVSGTPPTGFIYGSELTDTNAMKAEHSDNTHASHGTHVTGIAGGSGYGSSTTDHKKYRGMAFESDIVLVGIMPDSNQWQNTGMSDMIDGMNYIYTYAASVGKPAVINLSWGTPVGPHDGTSLFSQACDALTGSGKIFVCSAGNSGDTRIHLSKTFASNDTVVNTFILFDANLNTKNTWLDLWGDVSKTFCVQASLYNDTLVSSTGYVCLDNAVHYLYLKGTNGDTCFVTFTTSTSEFNYEPRVYISLYSRNNDTVCLSIKGTDGTINLWNGYVRSGEGYAGELVDNGRPWATSGDVTHTVSDLVSTHSAIAVGAYVSKSGFRSITGNSYTFGSYAHQYALAPFSSQGPTVDGRVKPDISAPGMCVVSSVNRWDSTYIPGGVNYTDDVSYSLDTASGKKYYYGQMSGTSMSSPATSGIVALMLQAHPYLTPDQVRTILAETAIKDTFTGPLVIPGNNFWGNGKINAYQAVLTAANLPSAISNISNTLNCTLSPNPNNGSFIITYTDDKEENLLLEIYDTEGRLALRENWKASAGSNSKNCNLNKVQTGIYLTRVSSKNGASTFKTVVE
ncbi:MAG: hypothetical protein JWO06_3882 [Bacteroidota bacterium]|nr:hypothetical protein [Bacteroidota bacterium]